jgi:hypothetical protein
LFSGKTIFISALDWGLGHASRCVPVISDLKKNNTVILGVTPHTSLIFNEEFPELEKIKVPAYNIQYSAFLPVGLKLLSEYPRIRAIMHAEKKLTEQIVREKTVDVVISDCRYGMHSTRCTNIIITHQVFLKAPF